LQPVYFRGTGGNHGAKFGLVKTLRHRNLQHSVRKGLNGYFSHGKRPSLIGGNHVITGRSNDLTAKGVILSEGRFGAQKREKRNK
jgi:hypothetical protein